MRLNKYIAHCGITSRRKAESLVKQGRIKVNGLVVNEPFMIIAPTDVVLFDDEPIQIEEKKVYLLLNKPKDVLCTVTDDRGRKTIIDLLGEDIKERVYPVGRLDRMTTGLILITNDGDLHLKMSHPRYEIRKVYRATLDQSISDEDLARLENGITLDDGPISVDTIHRIDEDSKHVVELSIHSGRNRIVRRIFQHLGFEVLALDRTMFAHLTKKNIGRGRYRHLTEQEIINLKYLGDPKK